MIIPITPAPPDTMDCVMFVAAAAEIAVIVVVIARGIIALFLRKDRS